MGEATFCFHDELIDFLPKKLRGRSVQYQLNGPVSVKHCIEALGVPHPEVALILANGSSVLFSYPVQEGDHLDVYSHNHGIEVNPSITLHSPLLIPPLFVLDNHLGKLAPPLSRDDWALGRRWLSQLCLYSFTLSYTSLGK